jgi:hydrogenase nickel incorporation protein HypA/HybF
MHELSIAGEILNLTLKEARGRRITSIKIALAEDGHTTPESLSEAFGLASQGTLAEGARLDIQKSNDFQTRVVELEVEED